MYQRKLNAKGKRKEDTLWRRSLIDKSRLQ